MLHHLLLSTLDDTAARAVRATLDGDHADRLATAIRSGRTLPPVLALQHADRVLVYDGAHRLEAHRRAAPLFLSTLEVEVEITGEGGPAEALALALGCNQSHGLPLSWADLRHRRELVLVAEEKRVAGGAKRRTSRDLAAVIGCSHTFVGEWYAEQGIATRRRKPAPPVRPEPGQRLIGGGEVLSDAAIRDRLERALRAAERLGVETFDLPDEPGQLVSLWLGGLDDEPRPQLDAALEAAELANARARFEAVRASHPEMTSETPCPPAPPAISPLPSSTPSTSPTATTARDAATATTTPTGQELSTEPSTASSPPTPAAGTPSPASPATTKRDPRVLPQAGDRIASPDSDGTVRVLAVTPSARGWDVRVQDFTPLGRAEGLPYGIGIVEWWDRHPIAEGDVRLERIGDRVGVWRQGILPEHAGRPVRTIEEAVELLAVRREPVAALPDGDEDTMLGEARERLKALEAQVADLDLREGIQRARADGWQRKATIAQEGADKLVDMQHRLDAAIDRERQAIARAERAEASLTAAQRDADGWPEGWTLDTMPRLPCWRAPRDSEGHRGPSAVVYEVAGGGYEAAMETPDQDTVEGALELLRRMAWGLAGRPLAASEPEPASVESSPAEAPAASFVESVMPHREPRWLVGVRLRLGLDSDEAIAWEAGPHVHAAAVRRERERLGIPEYVAPTPAPDPLALYRPWTRSADELAAHLEALPREDWEQVRQAFGVASGARIIERLTMRIMRDATRAA